MYIDDGVATVTFLCEASGLPRPVIGWLKNNSSVSVGTVMQNGSASSLVVASSEITEQPQKYSCYARNSLGNTLSMEATLVIAKRKEELQGRLSIARKTSTITHMRLENEQSNQPIDFVIIQR